MSFTPITVTFSYDNTDASPASGAIEFRRTAVISDGATIVVDDAEIVQLVAGAGSIILQANDDSTTQPVGSAYQVVERVDDAPHRVYRVVISHTAPSGTVNLATLMPASTTPYYAPQRGALWYEGAGAPGSITGQVLGDFYLNTTNADVWQLQSGGWTDVGNIRGATGPAGSAGPAGPTGPIGPAGGSRTVWNPAYAASLTINTATYNEIRVTAITGALAVAWSGTPLEGASSGSLIVDLTDDGTSRALTWTGFEASTVALPASTPAGQKMTLGFLWNPVSGAYRCVARS